MIVGLREIAAFKVVCSKDLEIPISVFCSFCIHILLWNLRDASCLRDHSLLLCLPFIPDAGFVKVRVFLVMCFVDETSGFLTRDTVDSTARNVLDYGAPKSSLIWLVEWISYFNFQAFQFLGNLSFNPLL